MSDFAKIHHFLGLSKKDARTLRKKLEKQLGSVPILLVTNGTLDDEGLPVRTSFAAVEKKKT